MLKYKIPQIVTLTPFIYLMTRNFRWAPNIGFGKVRSMLGSIIKRRS